MSAEIISSHIDVSPNEYVTKYSINRNFLKLVENDKLLSAEIDSKLDEGLVYSYIAGKTYSRGNCVFYKTSTESQSLYLLCCDAATQTSQSPSTYVNKSGETVVKSSDDWKIVGIPASTTVNPKDYALDYVASNKQEFLSVHQENTALSAHPTRELGMNNSTIAFTTLENVQEERETFFYPNQFRTLNPDNTIIAGYMRKWDNGLLEYDVIFRVGSNGEKSDDGQSLISANNLEVYHRNQNFLYFKDNADFNLFNQSNDYHITTNGTKQVNLNTNVNAYYGEIQFPEEFMDLNYMVFTSQEKNIETEAKSVNNEVLKPGEYDSRLKINGLTITGCDTEADFEKELVIPDEIVNIGKLALAYIEETNSLPVKITIDPDSSSLKNIEDRAFENSALRTVVIPKSARSIGENAFCNCLKLENVDLYVNRDKSKQPVIDFNAFDGATNLSTINLYYYSDTVGFAAATPSTEERISAYSSEYDLSSKICDTNFQKVFGINNGATKVTEIIIHDRLSDTPTFASAPKMAFSAAPAVAEQEGEQKEPDVDYVTISISDFLKKYQKASDDYLNPASPKMAFAAARPKFAALPTALRDCFYIEDNVITGWNSEVLTDSIALDFSDSTLTDIVGIGDEALANCSYISSLNVPAGQLTSIGYHAFYGCGSIQKMSFSRPDYSTLAISENAFDNTSPSHIDIACNNTACNLSVLFPSQVAEMAFTGNDSSELQPGVSAYAVDSLSVSGFTTIAASALVDVQSISNLVLFTPESKVLAIDEYAFACEQKQKLNLFVTRGNKGDLSCASRSFARLGYTDILTFDLENVQLDRNAFLETEGTTVKFTNWDKGRIITTSVGGKSMYELTAFAEGSMMDAAFSKIYFADLDDMEDVSKTLIVGTNKNVLSCRERTVLRSKHGDDITKTYGYTVYNGELISSPRSDYLYINDDNVVVSCNWDKIIEYQELEPEETRMTVPYGVTAISSDAFSFERPERCTSSITQITLPITLKTVYDRAFSDIRDLSVLNFEDGTELESMGSNIFTSATKILDKFSVAAEK